MIFANLKSNISMGLCINIDGLPIANSSKYTFWPILASVWGKIKLNKYPFFWNLTHLRKIFRVSKFSPVCDRDMVR